MKVIGGVAAALVLTLWASAAASGDADQTAPLAERVQVTAVRVNVVARGADGSPLAAVEPGELEVLEDGAPVRVLGVDPLVAAAPGAEEPGAGAGVEGKSTPIAAASRSVAVYVVPELCGRRSLGSMLSVLEHGAAALVGLGPVTVVSANPTPLEVASSLTDARKLTGAVQAISRAVLAESRVERVRRDFQRDMTTARTAAAKVGRARAAVYEERAILQGVFGSLMTWSAARPPEAGRVLVLGAAGFDMEPEDYYYDVLSADPEVVSSPAELARAQEELRALRFTELVTDAAATLATQGWTVLTIDSGRTIASFSNAADTSGHGRLSAFTSSRPEGGAASGDSLFYFLHPRDSLLTLAESTGGALVPPDGSIAGSLGALRGTFVLTYQVDRPPDGRQHSLEVRSRRAGLAVTAPRVVMSGTPEAVAAERARRVLDRSSGAGVVPVMATVSANTPPGRHRAAGRLSATVDLGRFADLITARGSVRLRVTVAVELKGQDPFIVHEQHDAAPARGGLWFYEAPIEWPVETRRMAVVVEELATGEWGAAVARVL